MLNLASKEDQYAMLSQTIHRFSRVEQQLSMTRSPISEWKTGRCMLSSDPPRSSTVVQSVGFQQEQVVKVNASVSLGK